MSSQEFDWTLTAEPTWKRIESFQAGESTPKFVTGEQSDDRIRVRYFYDENTREVWAFARFGYLAQGPPGHAHGGAVASVLDEVMGLAAWQADLSVVAAELSVRYKAPTPLFEELIAHAWIEEVEGPIARIKSSIGRREGRHFVEGGGRFVDIGKERFKNLANEAKARRKAVEESA